MGGLIILVGLGGFLFGLVNSGQRFDWVTSLEWQGDLEDFEAGLSPL